MGDVIRGKRTITLKQKVKSVRILATGTQFQGNSPANITLKAIAQNFDAVGYSWIKLSTNKQISTAQQITIKNAEIDVVDTYRVEVKDSKGDLYQDTISLTKVTDGKPGDVGKRGQIPVQREWKQGDTYYNNDSVMDYIYHRATDSWWRLRDGYNEVKAGVNPSNEFVQLNSLEHLALSYIIAENANLAGFIFKDNKLISQLPNVDNPNLIIDGVNGKITAKDADIKGHIEATSGKFTGEINATSGNIKNVNATNLTVENLNATNGTIKNIKGENIDINGGTFKGKVIFEDGSPALDTIDQKVKEGVDSVQVGGRNLFLLANQVKDHTYVAPYSFSFKNSAHSNVRIFNERKDITFNKGDKVVISYMVRGQLAKSEKLESSLRLGFNKAGTLTTYQYIYPGVENPKDMEWYKVKHILEITDTVNLWTFQIYNHRWSTDPEGGYYFNSIVEYKNIKVERGIIDTDFTEAPEDIESQMQDQEIYIEYSVDGKTNWHYPATSSDVYYRQKKGNGAWSANIRIAGLDGKDGANGEKGANGANGKDGKYQVQQYAKNTSLTVAPTSGWANAIPTSSDSEYIWMRTGEVKPPATAPTAWSAAMRITGNRGADGKDGKNGKDGVDGKAGKFSIYNFAKNTSLTSAPTTGWMATPPTISATEYLWQRIGDVVPPATAPTSWSNAVRISGPIGPAGKDGTNGKDGEKGSKGDNGKDGVNGTNGKDGKYVVVQFAKNSSFTTAPTTGWSTNQPTITDKEYLWMRTGEVTPPATAPTAWKTATRISGIRGQDGANGEDIKGVNLLSIKHLNEDKYIDTNGKEINNGTDFVAYLDYQEVIPTKPYYVGYFAIGAVNGGDSSSIDIFYYNASKAFISKQTFDNDKGQGIYQPKKLTIPASAKYVRFNFWNNANEYGLRIKLEQSDVATPYSPSYEDFGSALAPLQQTEIIGGTITTGVLGVSNNNRDIVAGLTGEGFSSNTDTVIWAGANHDKKHLAPFQVKADGSIIANNGKFSGEIDIKSGVVDGFLKVGSNAGVNGGKNIFSGGEGEYYEEWGEDIVFYVGEDANIPESEADRYLRYYVTESGYVYANSGQIGHWELGDKYLFNMYNQGVIVGPSSYRGGGIRNHQYVKDEHMYAVKIDDYPLSTKTRNLPEDKVKRDFGYIDIVGIDMYYDSIEDKVHPPTGISLKNAVISGFGVKTHIEYTNSRNIQDEETVIFDNNSAVLVVEMPKQQYVWEGKKVTIKALYPNSVLEVWIGAGKGFISYYGLSSSTKLIFGGKGVCVTMIYANDHWVVLHNTNWP
ncbi:collagen-like protein [Myroides sp. LoEW2-1]|uniref:collagen-like protein n=1 Tax=Myroides sp. LoEW2-1 TaxID=2683192 RepID=UPI0013285B3E|nr:collagen-like protein [Myroides sp. LoEW2-1]MVX36224.1 hypothetical protein [Myroides sp. LoEW2-1]